MMKNVGVVDALVRALLGIGMLVVAARLGERPFLALGAAAIALLLVGTALTRSCPLYVALGWSTRESPKPTGA